MSHAFIYFSSWDQNAMLVSQHVPSNMINIDLKLWFWSSLWLHNNCELCTVSSAKVVCNIDVFCQNKLCVSVCSVEQKLHSIGSGCISECWNLSWQFLFRYWLNMSHHCVTGHVFNHLFGRSESRMFWPCLIILLICVCMCISVSVLVLVVTWAVF